MKKRNVNGTYGPIRSNSHCFDRSWEGRRVEIGCHSASEAMEVLTDRNQEQLQQPIVQSIRWLAPFGW
jgi:hypothetical protein